MEDRLIRHLWPQAGRRLRDGQQALLETLLPSIAIDAGSVEPIEPRTLFADGTRELWLRSASAAASTSPHRRRRIPRSVSSAASHSSTASCRCWRRSRRAGSAMCGSGPATRAHSSRGCPPIGAARVHPVSRPVAEGAPPQAAADRFSLSRRLARVLAAGAELRVATDDRDYLMWILERLTAHPAFRWTAKCRRLARPARRLAAHPL